MASKYRYISAVGQINDMACWAASLKWWYKAVLSITPSQTKLWDRYKGMRDSFGGMPDHSMQHIINENAMTTIPYSNATWFTAAEVENLLYFGPIFTAYTESGTWKKHVNVIYELIGSGEYAEVMAMEPQAASGSGGAWIGKHQRKTLSDFNMLGSVYAGVNRKAFQEVALATG
jgi:hypothetical protein